MLFLLSAITLLAVIGAALRVPWDAIPEWTRVLPPVAYVVAASLLIMAEGGPHSSAVVSILLLPVLWAALYQRCRESVVVVVAIGLALTALSSAAHDTQDLSFTRIALWLVVAGLIAVVVHGLRKRLGEAIRRTDRYAKLLSLLLRASEELACIRDAGAVVESSLKWSLDLVGEGQPEYHSAQYFEVQDGMVRIADQHDRSGVRMEGEWPLADHPQVAHVVSTGTPWSAPTELDSVGPRLRPLIESVGVTHGMWAPIAPDGQVHGVLAVTGQGQAASESTFSTFTAFAHIMELSLANALSHDLMEELATTDALTGLANRRGFESALKQKPGRLPYAILSFDLDGLKRVNDEFGHGRGDDLLAGAAGALSRLLRRGDLIARVGGDEFAALIVDASVDDARRVAERMLHTLDDIAVAGVTPSMSIGVAAGPCDSDPGVLHEAADAAMYQAKRAGGKRYAVAQLNATPTGPLRLDGSRNSLVGQGIRSR